VTGHTVKDAVNHLLNSDPLLAIIINQSPQPTFLPHAHYYQELVQSIISQQLSVKAASTIEQRFVDLFDGDDFPSPEQIIDKDIESMRSAGLSRQKAGYIKDLAAKVIDGTVKFDHLDALSNDQIINELTKIKGVGIWTVHMFLMFCMGRLNVLPSGDLGIKNGIQKLYNLTTVPLVEDVELIAKTNNWHPYESVASWYVWQSLDNAPKL